MFRRFAFPLLTGLSLLFLLWLRFHQPPNTVDDAYITFRYARNLISGNGFVYNPGEHVLGTTTPAYAMLLALSALVSGYRDFPRLALLLNSLLTAIGFALVMRLTARLTGRRWVGLAAGLLLALDGRLLDFSTGGMESSFYVAAILATWVLVLENRTAWAAVMAGLACLIRPDGAALAAAFFGLLGWESLRGRVGIKRWPWKELGLFALVVAPWFVFAVLYFGQPIPQSVLAKSAVYRVPPFTAFRALIVQLRAVFPFSLPPLQARNRSRAKSRR
jgi:arabinofuranosyltransferase